MADGLTVDGLSAGYDAPVFHDVAFAVAPGRLLAVLGRSGCGKSTLLRVIAGLHPPLSGRVTLAGDVLTDGSHRVPVERRRVGLVFQEYALFPDLDVLANVAFSPHATRDRAATLLDAVGLADLAGRRPAALSGGQQQRVAVARALAAEPRALLLDEPFANLDTALRTDLGTLLVERVRAAGCAAVLVTHDRADALRLADDVLVMLPGGRVGQHGSPAEVWTRPASPEVAALVCPGAAVPGTADGTHAQTPLGRMPLARALSGDVTAWLRPSDAVFVPDDDGPVVARSAVFVGPHAEVGLGVGRVHAEAPVAPGTRGRVTVRRPLWAWPA